MKSQWLSSLAAYHSAQCLKLPFMMAKQLYSVSVTCCSHDCHKKVMLDVLLYSVHMHGHSQIPHSDVVCDYKTQTV